MKRIVARSGYLVAALLLTVALGLAGYAIAVGSVSEPARPLPVDQSQVDELAPAPAPSPTATKPAPIRSVDDKGGEDKSGSGSNSGSGSSNSGSGSSGSGSDDHPDDD